MNVLQTRRRTAILETLVEGNSVNSTARLTRTSKTTVLKLLVDAGNVCKAFQDRHLRNLNLNRIECDEIWTFCRCKEKNVPKKLKARNGIGDVWTWTAIDPETKLVPCWYVGKRDEESANIFMEDLASRINGKLQLTSDGLRYYPTAVQKAFKDHTIDFATTVKEYGKIENVSDQQVIGFDKHVKLGNPNPKYISTSICERQNLTMRMSMRRFTRKTNAYSRKIENLIAAVDLHFMYYNFIRIHGSLKTTPAIAAGVTKRQWKLRDVINLMN